ncbi:MAG: TonB-dependent receptor, partial [Novosphingobium sp.]
MKFLSKSALYRATSLESAAIAVALLGVAGVATPAYAQDAAAPQAEACADENKNGVCDTEERSAIVVTGSRIARPNLESAVPIASIGGEEFVSEGNNNIGEVLNELPQLRSTFSQQNPGLGIGIAGLNLLDLRGL